MIASYSAKDRKQPRIAHAILKLDVLKFFLQVAWESNALSSKRYIHLSEHLTQIGRMLGGWYKQAAPPKSPAKGRA